eukprot:COSAG06_NODE_32783_length_500_cov_1.192020_1_plen_71_part_01
MVETGGANVAVTPAKGGVPGVFTFPTDAGKEYTVSPPASRRLKADDDTPVDPESGTSGPMFHFDCSDPQVP